MSQINNIRDLSKMGYGISEIHDRTGADPKTIRKYLEQDNFSPAPPVKKSRESIVTPYIDIITGWLQEDQKHWSKQRHTAKRIHERLVEEYGFTGSYDPVQKYVQKIRKDIQTKGTQELMWEPGCAQVDFGEADFNVDGVCVRKKSLTCKLFSNKISSKESFDSYMEGYCPETETCPYCGSRGNCAIHGYYKRAGL